MLTGTALYSTPGGQAPVITLGNNQKLLSISKQPWQFYWQKLYTPADFQQAVQPDLVLSPIEAWHRLELDGKKLPRFGYATYRLLIGVKSQVKNLGLRVPAPFTSHIIFINGVKVAQAGNPAATAEETTSARRTATVYFNQPAGKPLEIIIQVANFIHSKAGLRDTILLGQASELRQAEVVANALDLFSIGIIFSVMLYHLVLYLLRRHEKAYLVFFLTALVYFFLAFMFGQQNISLLFPDLPVWLHIRLASAIAYMVPPLLLYFIYTLFSRIIGRYFIVASWAISGIFLLLLFLPVHIFTRFNLFFYAGIAAPSFIFTTVLAARAAWQKRPGALLLFSGLLSLVALTLYAVYLFLHDLLAGSAVSMGFAIFVLFQAAALAREHAQLDIRNQQMQLRLNKSRDALQKQRSQIEANLHDSIGGSLTDLKISTDNLKEHDLPAAAKEQLGHLSTRVDNTIKSLRTQLLFLEDIELVMEDFFPGMQLILLRRYTAANREFEYHVADSAFELVEREDIQWNFSYDKKLDYIMVLQEVCTNSLKYGREKSIWIFKARENQLVLTMTCPLASTEETSQADSGGLGSKTIKQRLEQLGGTFRELTDHENYRLVFSVKLT